MYVYTYIISSFGNKERPVVQVGMLKVLKGRKPSAWPNVGVGGRRGGAVGRWRVWKERRGGQQGRRRAAWHRILKTDH
jgi:hypothetical protein